MAEGALFDVFISYSRTDGDAVRRVQTRLKEAGLATFFDLDMLPAGQAWLPALEKGIAQCGAVAVFVGPAGFGTWQQREVQLALDRQVNEQRQGRTLPVIPVLLPQTSDPPGGFLRLNTWVDLRADLNDPRQLDLLLAGIRGKPTGEAGREVKDAICPYRGLLAFREEDAGLFFGREVEIEELLGKVRSERLITVVGRSGSGKSSVIYAGLIPALRRRVDGRTWAVRSLRPGSEPLHALVRAFDPPAADLAPFEADRRIEEQVDILRREDGALGRRVRRMLEEPTERGTDQLLLYVDQWEELYTQALNSAASHPARAIQDVTRFIDLVIDAARGSGCTAILTIRADFYGDLLKHGALSAAVPGGLVNLGPMDRDDLVATIRKPAEFVSLRVNGPLVEQMLDDVDGDLAKLPLLEHALKETWQRREGNRLTLNAYGEAGGINGAIAQRANDIYARLGAAEQAAARRLFVSLVAPGEGREDTRARVVYPENDEAICTVVRAFSDASARLLVTGGEGLSAQRMVEMSHEVLIREWGKLKEWIEINRDTLRRREHIRARVRQWEEQQRDPTLLLPPGLPLEEGRRLLADHGDVLIDGVRPFIETSIALDEARREGERRRVEEERRRDRNRLRIALVAAAVTIIFASIAMYSFVNARAQADHARAALAGAELSDAVKAVGMGQAAAGLAHLAAAIRWSPETVSARSLVVATLSQRTWFFPITALRHEDVVNWAQFSPDGTRVVTTSDKTARVWDAHTGAALGEPLRHESWVNSAQFSPDGTWVVTASGDKTARVWDARTGAALGEPLRHETAVWSAQFSPDGTRVVTSSANQTAQVWNVRTGAALGRPLGHEGALVSAEFSPDGMRVVTASGDKTARVWDARTGAALGEPLRHGDELTSARFSPDGTRVVTSSGDKTARVWDARTGAALGEPLRHESWVTSAQFSPDGTRVVTASRDNTARVWDARTGTALGEPLRHESWVLSAQFSPDGTRVVTASADHTARVWDARTGTALGEPLRQRGEVFSAQFSPDGMRVVTASGDKTALVWDVRTNATLSEPLRQKGQVFSAEFSPDGMRVVTASGDKTARVWDARTGAALGEPLRHGDELTSAQFSPDGTRVVTASRDKTARVWDVRTGAALGEPLRHESWVTSAQFSPDGTRVVTASWDGTARVWDARTGAALGELLRDDFLSSARFSPDGTCVVTTSWDKTARMWDARTGAALGKPLRHEDGVTSAQFSPDSTRVVTTSGETARVWDARTGAALGEPLRHERVVRRAQFSPDGTRVVTASGDHTAQVWDARTGAALGEPLRHGDIVFSAQFSPDGTRVVTASGDKTARVWDARTGAALGEPLRHGDTVFSAQFSPDGTRVVTASADHTARVWDVMVAPADAQQVAALAEAVGGLTVNGSVGAVVPVSDQLRRLDDFRAKARSTEQISSDPAFEAFFRWFFADPTTRTISPLSAMTQEEYRSRMNEPANVDGKE